MSDRRPPPPNGPILRLGRDHGGWDGKDRPEAADAPFALERLTVLAHEIANLLDGSLRCLGLARGSLQALPAHHAELDAVRRYVDTVNSSLERMADLVNAAMRGTASVVGSPSLSPKRTICLSEALAHAADVIYPEAHERGVEIHLDLAPAVAPLPIGPLYSVLLNGLRNALEAITREHPASKGRSAPASTGGGGRIDVVGRRRPLGSRRGAFDLVELEIRDDGPGISGLSDASAAFSFGFSTKPGGMGVGLALSREVVAEMGGTIELLPRTPPLPAPRPGAVLRICYPVARDERH